MRRPGREKRNRRPGFRVLRPQRVGYFNNIVRFADGARETLMKRFCLCSLLGILVAWVPVKAHDAEGRFIVHVGYLSASVQELARSYGWDLIWDSEEDRFINRPFSLVNRSLGGALTHLLRMYRGRLVVDLYHGNKVVLVRSALPNMRIDVPAKPVPDSVRPVSLPTPVVEVLTPTPAEEPVRPALEIPEPAPVPAPRPRRDLERDESPPDKSGVRGASGSGLVMPEPTLLVPEIPKFPAVTSWDADDKSPPPMDKSSPTGKSSPSGSGGSGFSGADIREIFLEDQMVKHEEYDVATLDQSEISPAGGELVTFGKNRVSMPGAVFQILSLNSRERAEQHYERLKELGYDVRIQVFSKGEETWYRLRIHVSPENDPEEVQAELKDLGYHVWIMLPGFSPVGGG